jgi:hypothetical protein
MQMWNDGGVWECDTGDFRIRENVTFSPKFVHVRNVPHDGRLLVGMHCKPLASLPTAHNFEGHRQSHLIFVAHICNCQCLDCPQEVGALRKQNY